jgi:hypothetical protein
MKYCSITNSRNSGFYVNNTKKFSPSVAVETLHLYYKDESVNAVQGNIAAECGKPNTSDIVWHTVRWGPSANWD